jgi:predicted DNA binding CopG/RHH family protein
MNSSHIIGRKKNRIKRCRKSLAKRELTQEQRLTLQQRISELEQELSNK